jgi:hypothetical protein
MPNKSSDLTVQPDSPRPQPRKKKTAIAREEFILLLAMIAGIAAKNIWDNINKGSEILVNPVQIVAALILAPMVYLAAAERLTKQKSLSLVSFFIAFQYGFFWQSIFDTAQNTIA